ncbi:c-type cytochrome [Marivita sp. GX14005]|uniref:c-type cytochrome n=1 Tax=Marivita sp. GX14005 TaxID=2942276 RepID=UPI002018453E|nr:c-type cytochrome [Marivita sp. GX14005]MCL3880750.1 c-type cytochrome [Marivita sp. GX14005]
MRAQGIRLGIAGAMAATLTACTPEEMPAPSDGRALFMENCAICHGADGKGDGAMARAMRQPPPDLTLIALRRGGTFPKAEILSTIDGYARSDLSGPDMPEFGELLKGDLVPVDTGDGIMTPTPRKLVALMEYIQSIQAQR